MRAAIEFRGLRPTDVPLIVSDWTDAHKNGATGGDPFAALLGHRSYVRAFRAMQLRAIEKGRVVVAEFPSAPVGCEIVGWACAEGDVLHFVAVKRQFRGQGIGHALVERIGFAQTDDCAASPRISRHSHLTRHGVPIVRAYRLLYDPFAFVDGG